MKLSENFTLEELCVTTTGIPNIPNQTEICKLLYLATYILQPIRNQFGPLQINSAFRCLAVNTAIGGDPDSQHPLGEATDILILKAPEVAVFEWCIANLVFGEIILEHKALTYIHITLPQVGKVVREALVYRNGVYTSYKSKLP